MTEAAPEANFVSNAAKGLAPRGPEIGNRLLHEGVSVFSNLKAATKKIAVLERGGHSVRGVAQLTLRPSQVTKTLGRHHYTLTGDPAAITRQWIQSLLR